MNEFNYLENALQNNNQLVEKIKDASLLFFNSLTDKKHKLYTSKSKDHILKTYALPEKDTIYLLEKKENKLTIYEKIIYDFEKEQTMKEHFQYALESVKEKSDIYLDTIFSIDSSNNNVKKETNEEYFNYLLEEGKTTQESIQKLKKLLSTKLQENEYYFYDNFAPKNTIKTTFRVDGLKSYFDLLEQKGNLETGYEDDFYKKYMETMSAKQNEKLEDIIISINYFKDVCSKQLYKSRKNSFEYNSDNSVWEQNDKLILIDQTCGFYIDKKDDQNFTVYFLDKEYKDLDEEITKIENAITTESINQYKDIVLKVENGKTILTHQVLMYVFQLNLDFAYLNMKQEGLGEKSTPIDITTYEYQKNYYHHNYRLDEFEFLCYVFLTMGGGFEYNKTEGKFIGEKMKYQSSLKNNPNELKEKYEEINYCYPVKVSYLNQDWLKGLKLMVNILKRDEPKPISFEGDDEQDAIQKAIAYYDIKIKKLEKSLKP